jgi:hypothetical protein
MADNFLKRLSDSSSLTDVMIQMEDFMDSLDLYVFKNWFEGEIVDGPNVSRYWVSMTLKYEYKDMPDPAGGLRLLKHGAKVRFRQSKEEDTETKTSLNQTEIQRIMTTQTQPGQAFLPDGAMNMPGYPEQLPLKKIWLVDIEIPRQFIEDLEDDELDLYDKDTEDEAAPFKSQTADKDADNSEEDAGQEPESAPPVADNEADNNAPQDLNGGGG